MSWQGNFEQILDGVYVMSTTGPQLTFVFLVCSDLLWMPLSIILRYLLILITIPNLTGLLLIPLILILHRQT